MPKPPKLSTVTIAEPRWAPGRFILFRVDLHDDHVCVWCGRSMGWRPFDGTSKAFFHLFPSMEAAEEAANKYIKLPVQTE